MSPVGSDAPAPRDASGASTSSPTNAHVRSELNDYLHSNQLRRRLFPRAAIVGAASGLIAVAFRAALVAGDGARNALIAWAKQYPLWGWLVPMVLCGAGATMAVWLVRRFAPEASGSGIPHLKAVLHRLRELDWRRVLPVKFVGGVLALSSGLALGREGPTVQMGGAVSDAISGWLRVTPRERLTLIAAGAGAGLAAAFNAPLSGLIFVLEEVQRDFRPAVFGAAFIAAAVANVIARFAAGQLPVFLVPSYATPPLESLPAFAMLGIVAGLLGVAFNRSLLVTLNLYARVTGRRLFAVIAALGAVIGLIAWFNPALIGNGHTLAEQALDGQLALAALPAIFAVRFILTMSSYGTGAAGGIFAPLLVLGSVLGLAIGQVTHAIAPGAAPEPAAFAVVGMAAYFTAIVRAPLTGVVLIIEMTGNYNQMLPLLVACFFAYTVAEHLRDLPIYEALLKRDLLRSGVQSTSDAPMVVELMVEPGSPFDGRIVRDLGLPPGCILASYRVGDEENIPTATTRLDAHMRITALISAEATGAMQKLRHGCEAR